MANVKITDLSAIADPASTDVLPVVDVTADTTNKISIAEILRTAPEGTAAAPAIAFEGDSNTGIYHPGSEQIGFATSGIGRVFIASDGNVGIGTSSPAAKLDVNGNLRVTGGVGDTGTGLVAYTESSGEFKSVLAAFRLALFTGQNNSRTESLRINENGNVGIGTSDPDRPLHIKSTGLTRIKLETSSNSSNADITCYNSNGLQGVFGYSSVNDSIDLDSRSATGAITFSRSGSERMRINSNGNVGIGTSSPSQKLDVNGNAYINGQLGINQPSPDSGTYLQVNSSANWNFPPIFIQRDASNIASDIKMLAFGLEADTAGQTQATNACFIGLNTDSAPTTGDTLLSENARMNLTAPNGVVIPNGNVGIGTSDPATKLAIQANSNVTTDYPLSIKNLADNYGSSLGAYGFSNRSLGATNIDFTADIGNDLIIKTSDSEKMRIDSSGRLLVGTSATLGSIAGFGTNEQQIINNAGIGGYVNVGTSDNAFGPLFLFAKSRGGTTTIVQNGDTLGEIRFAGADGTDLNTTGAAIRAMVDGTPGVNDLPTRLVFATTADGASSPTERMRITSNGNVGIGTINPSTLLEVNGSLSKNSGSFKIDHPLPALTKTHHLVHSFVEAPDASNLYAGMVQLSNGVAVVNIDTAHRMTEGTFEALNNPQSWSSSNESGYAPVKSSLSGNLLTIECQDQTSSDTVYYEVRGIRKDQHMIETEWTDESGRVITEPLKQGLADAGL